MSNTYSDSNGKRWTKAQIDIKVKQAKQQLIEDLEYPHCKSCGRSSGVRLDCSHIISVKEAQESGKCELAWDIGNLELLCRDCHMKHENLNHEERKQKYEKNK